MAALLLASGAAPALSQSVTVAIDRNSFLPLAGNLSGANISSPDTPVQFGDPAVRTFVRPLQPGMLRWPGGTVNDFFVWRTGLIPPPAGSATSKTRPGVPTPIDVLRSVFAPYPSIKFNKQIPRATDQLQPILAGKGGNPLGDRTQGFAGFATALGARFVVVVNATTNTVEAAEGLGFAVARRGLPVVGFELVNEPYFIQIRPSDGPIVLPPGSPPVAGAYASGGDYLTKIKPYRDAIKRGFLLAGVDPARAVVAIGGGFAGDTASFNTQWAADLAAYAQAHGAWWDAVAYHFYPAESKSDDFSDKMTYANDGLASGTDPFIASYRANNFSRGKALFLTEFDVALNDRVIEGSVYGGIFCAEYVARMSRFPETANVMLHELFSSSDGIGVPDTAIDGDGDWRQKLTAAGQAGQVLDATGRIRGLFYTAQILGLGLVNAAVNASDRVLGTAVTGATGSVPTRTGTIPAVFAQAYRGRDGSIHLIATNKGEAAVIAQIVVDGTSVTTPLAVDRLAPTDGDPAQSNTASAQPVRLAHGTAQGTVTLPRYSATHLVFAAP